MVKDLDKVNILLIDDQPAKLLSYEVILAELGENLIKANSPQEALGLLLRTENVAVVLIDVVMPGIDGFQLAAMAYGKIFEITQTPMALSEDNLKALGQRVMFYAQHGQIGPLAIVAASDESYAQAQIFANAANVSRPLQIFRELHAARQWLDAQATSP